MPSETITLQSLLSALIGGGGVFVLLRWLFSLSAFQDYSPAARRWIALALSLILGPVALAVGSQFGYWPLTVDGFVAAAAAGFVASQALHGVELQMSRGSASPRQAPR